MATVTKPVIKAVADAGARVGLLSSAGMGGRARTSRHR